MAAAGEPKSTRTDAFGDPLPDGASGRLGTSRWKHEAKVVFVAYADGGKQVVSSCGQGVIHIWDAETGRLIRNFGERFKIESSGVDYDSRYYDWDDDYPSKPSCLVAVAQQGPGVAVAGPDGQVHVWDRSTGKELHTFKTPEKLEFITFTADGKSLVTRARSGLVKVWNTERQEFTGQYGKERQGSGSGSGADWDPDYEPYDSRSRSGQSLPVVSPDGKLVARITVKSTGLRHYSSGSPPAKGSSGDTGEEDESACELHLWKLGENKEFKIKVNLGVPERESYGNEMTMPVFSPDGKNVAICRAHGAIYLIDVDSGKQVKKIARDGSGDDTTKLTRLAFSHDGKKLAAQAVDGKVLLYDCASGDELQQVGGEKIDEEPRRVGRRFKTSSGSGHYGASFLSEPTTIAWSPDSKTVIEAQGRLVRLWNAESGKGNDLSGGHLGEVSGVVVAADGKTVLTLGTDRTVRQWDVAKTKEIKKCDLPDTFVQCGLVSPATALVVGADGSVSLWDPLENKTEPGLPQVGEDALGGSDREPFAISANHKTIVHATGRVLIRSMNMEKNSENKLFLMLDLTMLNIMSDPRMRAMACSPDGQTLAARVDLMPDRFRRSHGSGRDEEPPPARADLRLYHVERGNLIWSREAGSENCSALTFSPNGKSIAMINGKGEEVTLVEAATGKIRARFKVAAVSLAYSPDGVFFGLGTQDGGVKVIDARDGKDAVAFSGHNGKVTSLAFNSDASTLYSSSVDGTVLVWNIQEATAKARPRAAVSAERANQLWEALADPDGDKAYEAIVALGASPKQAGALLSDHLKPAKVLEEAQVDKLIAELDGDNFEGRQKALRELGKTGPRFRHIFEDALANDPAPETRKQLEQLLAWLEPGTTMPDILRDNRAIEVLETLATPEARALLESYTKGARGSPLTREAAAALKRLGK
jgi:WD40 repeat protein